MYLQKHDYEKFAEAAVTNFVNGEIALNDSILKIAEANDLNPDQIKRVVEMSNTQAFLKLYGNQEEKTANVEFEVADSGKILKDYYKQPELTKVASDLAEQVPDEFELFLSEIPNPMEKTASDSSEQGHYYEEPKQKLDKYALINSLRKVASNMKDKIYEEEHYAIDGIEKLSSDFAGLYGPDYEEFEKEALLIHGTYITPILNDIRGNIRHSKPMFDLEKVGSSRVVINGNSDELKVLKEVIDHKVSQTKYAEAVNIANGKIGRLLG